MRTTVSCNCILCIAQKQRLSDGQDVRQLVQTIKTTDPERAEMLEWYIEHEYTPISLDELPAPNEQIFWDALGVLALSDKFVYQAGDSSIEVGDGKIAVAIAGNRREYECISQMRADTQHSDSFATAVVQLTESAIRYIHADCDDYEAHYRIAGADMSVDVNFDEEVVHIDLKSPKDGSRIHLRYGMEEFLVSQDPLVLEAQEWMRDERPELLEWIHSLVAGTPDE